LLPAGGQMRWPRVEWPGVLIRVMVNSVTTGGLSLLSAGPVSSAVCSRVVNGRCETTIWVGDEPASDVRSNGPARGARGRQHLTWVGNAIGSRPVRYSWATLSSAADRSPAAPCPGPRMSGLVPMLGIKARGGDHRPRATRRGIRNTPSAVFPRPAPSPWSAARPRGAPLWATHVCAALPAEHAPGPQIDQHRSRGTVEPGTETRRCAPDVTD
jgi:hypothetical protein